MLPLSVLALSNTRLGLMHVLGQTKSAAKVLISQESKRDAFG